MPDDAVAALLGRMRADDAADAIADLRQSRRRRVLDLMPAPQRTKVITLMGFNPQSAGGLMNVDFVSCAATATATEGLALVAAARGLQPEALLKLHVLDEDKRLTGVVSVIALLQADPGESVGNLMDSDPVRISANADLTDIALLMADYNLYAIPVVDEQDRVLGVVTATTSWRQPSRRTGVAANPPPAPSAKPPSLAMTATRLCQAVRQRELDGRRHHPARGAIGRDYAVPRCSTRRTWVISRVRSGASASARPTVPAR